MVNLVQRHPFHLVKLDAFVLSLEKKVSKKTQTVFKSKTSFFLDDLKNSNLVIPVKTGKRFQGRYVKIYCNIVNDNTYSFLKGLNEHLLSKQVYINNFAISIERNFSAEKVCMGFHLFGLLELGNKIDTRLSDYFSFSDYDIEYASCLSNLTFSKRIAMLLADQYDQTVSYPDDWFFCKYESPDIKVELSWKHSITLFIAGEFDKAGILLDSDQSFEKCKGLLLQPSKSYDVWWVFCLFRKEAEYNLDKWLSAEKKRNPFAVKQGSPDEALGLIYFLYVGHNEELLSLRSRLHELSQALPADCVK
jgi:hypothetical protein